MKDQIDVFDAHCDALLLRLLYGGTLRENGRHLDLKRMSAYRRYVQFFAIWGDAQAFPGCDLRGAPPESFFPAEYELFRSEMEANRDCISFCRSGEEIRAALEGGKMAALLSVEGGELLGCSLERLEEAHAKGVRAVNLTWNHANALSGSNAERPELGLTRQGRDFVRKMERLGMLVDVSHLSDPGFWDVADMLSGPFIASHSNARSVFFHPRNLTDAQFTAIIEHNGVAGLNLYANFLGEKAGVDTVIAHLEHCLDLGGAAHVALGTDFDGCSLLPAGISGVQDLERLWERLLQRNYGRELLRALFFENLMRVVSEVCTM
ncbi:membrane dipeptidase [Lawsonibacter celer]|uniref:membrane dipeptidase n=1 Tax=Lawsonibacter celer TaxID=2986526 RepID=UPI001648C772